ncbi:helix-turn-helix transcriptional regulator [Saccharopolyspora endophytica]|uniref:helix-turn-helix transcriptional regulator n=1 Tax=Saccharopolyspora endophytica TaxID=543886 RepID=UPI0027DD68D4|nr:helix-turn-helix transcriptional regulator [Saccharopolyspora endophytica]
MPPEEPRIANDVLIDLRERNGLSQQDLADELTSLATQNGRAVQITRKTISRWERGEVVWPQPLYRRLLAEFFNCAGDELGFRRPRSGGREQEPAGLPQFTFAPTTPTIESHVERDQDAWRQVRSALGRNRHDLAVLAESLYPDYRVPGLKNTGAISAPNWIPDEPITLDEITLTLDGAVPEPTIMGGGPDSSAVRPLATAETRYRLYHDAVRDLAAPRLFENRLCFRLLGLDWQSPGMRFGQMGFFDAIDTNEVLAHEFAAHHLVLDGDKETLLPRATIRGLKFRKAVADPFDLDRRPLMGAIGTLTIRGGDSPSVILHQRDSGSVAGGGGMAHLLPAGIFQPSSVIPTALDADFSLWRNIQREYAEELLGHDEYDGSGKPIRYDKLEPFMSMDKALHAGHIRVFCLGVTLDALTLAGDILTVAVIAPETYDAMFANAVTANPEGAMPARAFPFEENTLTWLRESRQLSPGAAAALHFAWANRKLLVG